MPYFKEKRIWLTSVMRNTWCSMKQSGNGKNWMTLFSSSKPTSQYFNTFQNVVASKMETPPNLGVGDPVRSWIACVFPKVKKSRTLFLNLRYLETSSSYEECPAPTLMAKLRNKTCCLTRQSSNETSRCIRRKLIKTLTQRRFIFICDYY